MNLDDMLQALYMIRNRRSRSSRNVRMTQRNNGRGGSNANASSNSNGDAFGDFRHKKRVASQRNSPPPKRKKP